MKNTPEFFSFFIFLKFIFSLIVQNVYLGLLFNSSQPSTHNTQNEYKYLTEVVQGPVVQNPMKLIVG